MNWLLLKIIAMDKGQDALGSDLHMLSFVGGGGGI